METAIEYERDFYSWLMQNVGMLREGRFTEIDAEHIAEELESMGRREKRERVSCLTTLLVHLLKWKYQSVRRSRSWKNIILTQRIDIKELLEDSPSLHYEIEKKIKRAYKKARLKAEDETGMDKKHFPKSCPFSPDQILDKAFFPEEEI